MVEMEYNTAGFFTLQLVLLETRWIRAEFKGPEMQNNELKEAKKQHRADGNRIFRDNSPWVSLVELLESVFLFYCQLLSSQLNITLVKVALSWDKSSATSIMMHFQQKHQQL